MEKILSLNVIKVFRGKLLTNKSILRTVFVPSQSSGEVNTT